MDRRQSRDGLLLESSASGQISKSGGRVASRARCALPDQYRDQSVEAIRLRRTRKRLRFANNRFVCSSVGGVAAGSSVEHKKIACGGRGCHLLIIDRTPAAGTVNDRGFPESLGSEGQHDAPAQTKLLGLLQGNKISAARSRADKRYSMAIAGVFLPSIHSSIPLAFSLADAIRRRLRNRPASAPISGTTRLISTSVARLIAFKKAGSEPA